MSNSYRLIHLLLLVVFLFSIACSDEIPNENRPDPDPYPYPDPDPEGASITSPDIFRKSTEGYSCFRIPALIKTKDNSLLA